MDPTYFLLLIFVPVPVMLSYAMIVVSYERKKQSILAFNYLPSKKIPTKFTGPENQKIGQPSASSKILPPITPYSCYYKY